MPLCLSPSLSLVSPLLSLINSLVLSFLLSLPLSTFFSRFTFIFSYKLPHSIFFLSFSRFTFTFSCKHFCILFLFCPSLSTSFSCFTFTFSYKLTRILFFLPFSLDFTFRYSENGYLQNQSIKKNASTCGMTSTLFGGQFYRGNIIHKQTDKTLSSRQKHQIFYGQTNMFQ